VLGRVAALQPLNAMDADRSMASLGPPRPHCREGSASWHRDATHAWSISQVRCGFPWRQTPAVALATRANFLALLLREANQNKQPASTKKIR